MYVYVGMDVTLNECHRIGRSHPGKLNYLNIHRKVTRFRHRSPPPPITQKKIFSRISLPLEKFNDRYNVILQYLNHRQLTKNSNFLDLVYMHVYSKQLL